MKTVVPVYPNINNLDELLDLAYAYELIDGYVIDGDQVVISTGHMMIDGTRKEIVATLNFAINAYEKALVRNADLSELMK